MLEENSLTLSLDDRKVDKTFAPGRLQFSNLQHKLHGNKIKLIPYPHNIYIAKNEILFLEEYILVGM